MTMMALCSMRRTYVRTQALRSPSTMRALAVAAAVPALFALGVCVFCWQLARKNGYRLTDWLTTRIQLFEAAASVVDKSLKTMADERPGFRCC